MGHHNLHFTDREAALNWANNYGGTFHDNMHSRGDDSGTNFTVREEFEDGNGEERESELHRVVKVFPNGAIVYHWEHGKGYVYYHYECDMFNGYFNVYYYDKKTSHYYNANDMFSEECTTLLSYTPYTLELGGYSRDKSFLVISKDIRKPL